MDIVIGFSIAYMVGLIAFFIYQIVSSNNRGRLKFLKSFKNGKFVLIYFAAFPLFFLAHRFNGNAVDGAIWLSFKSCIEAVLLRFDYASTKALMAESTFYKAAVEMTFSLVTLNAVVFTASFVGEVSVNAISLFVTKHFRKKIIVVVGEGKDTLDILKSAKQCGKAVYLTQITADKRDEALLCHADIAALQGDDNIADRLKKMFGSFAKKKVSVILNCEDDAKSLIYVKQLIGLIDRENIADLPLNEGVGLGAYVFGQQGNAATFLGYVQASRGIIKFVNRHELISLDFIDRYPLTEFMGDNEIDIEKGVIRPDVDLNVFMIGFGNLNETLFLNSVSNDQFLTVDKHGVTVPKPVNYYIFDRYFPQGKMTRADGKGEPPRDSVLSKSLHHGYLRYQEFLKTAKQEDYFEFVPLPANVNLKPFDVTHPGFYGALRDVLQGKKSFSYIIVSFGSDTDNIELGLKLQQKLAEWDARSTVKVFIKVRSAALVDAMKEDFASKGVIAFGTNRDIVYSAPKILNEKLDKMAKLRHTVYTAETNRKKGLPTDSSSVESLARKKWFVDYPQRKRESNLFACLSIRARLQLLGFDYVPESAEGEDATDKFLKKYHASANGETDIPVDSHDTVYRKTIWVYSNGEQGKNSVRARFAELEHRRWCANMICNGVIPLKKEEVAKRGVAEDGEKRMHSNVTTIAGLKEFRNDMAVYKIKFKNGADHVPTKDELAVAEEEEDVIRYDYQLMDDVVWLLNSCGFKIVERK